MDVLLWIGGVLWLLGTAHQVLLAWIEERDDPMLFQARFGWGDWILLIGIMLPLWLPVGILRLVENRFESRGEQP